MKKLGISIRNFFIKNRKALVNFLFIAIGVIAISLISMFSLMAFDVIYYDGGVKFNLEIFASFSASWYGWIFFILLQIVLTMLLCVIPGVSMAFILLSQTIYPIPWQAFLLCFISVMSASTAMYCIGRFGGYKEIGRAHV